jgi:hypothetical protein
MFTRVNEFDVENNNEGDSTDRKVVSTVGKTIEHLQPVRPRTAEVPSLYEGSE